MNIKHFIKNTWKIYFNNLCLIFFVYTNFVSKRFFKKSLKSLKSKKSKKSFCNMHKKELV